MANAAGHVIGHVLIDSVPGLVPSSFSALVHGREPGPYLGGDAWLAPAGTGGRLTGGLRSHRAATGLKPVVRPHPWPRGGPANRYSAGGAMMGA